MNRYKMIVEYFGPFFKGFQRQKDLITVQGCLEHALFLISGEERAFTCAGRTDSGVHALSQVVHVNLQKKFDPYRLYRGMNHLLSLHYKNDYILPLRIKDVEEVDPLTFHARTSAKSRLYLYRISGRPASLFDHLRTFGLYKKLDIDKMKEVAQCFIGKHDFSCFRSAECQAKSPIKTLSRCDIEQKEEELYIWVHAPSFLHHQVRLMVGCLIDVGLYKISKEGVLDLLHHPTSFSNQFFMAPAHGLYFHSVFY